MSTFIRLAVPGCDLASGEGADLLHLEVGIVGHRGAGHLSGREEIEHP